MRTEHYGLLRRTTAPNIKLDALRYLGIHEVLELVEFEEGSAVVEASTGG